MLATMILAHSFSGLFFSTKSRMLSMGTSRLENILCLTTWSYDHDDTYGVWTVVPTLHIRLLGDFSLIYDDRQVTSLNTLRLQSLLTYLVLHRDVPQQRQHLAFLFWPDTTEAQARNNLRQLLHQLRQALPSVKYFLSADTHMLHWHPVTPFHLDVAEFEQALTEAAAATRRNDQRALQAALEQADSLYRGELLPGCYDEWLLPERERLRQRHLQVLEQLLRLFEGQG